MFVSKRFLENISRWNLIIQEVFFSKNLSIINRLIHIMFIRTPGFFTIGAARTLNPDLTWSGIRSQWIFWWTFKSEKGKRRRFSFNGISGSREKFRNSAGLQNAQEINSESARRWETYEDFQILCDNTSWDMYRNTLFVLVCCYITSHLSRGFLCVTDGASHVTQLKIFQMLFACWFACTVTEDYPIRQRVQEDHHTADTQRDTPSHSDSNLGAV